MKFQRIEIVGIVGLNGSGKSTLSNLIAGVTMPNKGTVDIKGSAALIAISSGLNGQLTGIENIELKGLMMGITKRRLRKLFLKSLTLLILESLCINLLKLIQVE